MVYTALGLFGSKTPAAGTFGTPTFGSTTPASGGLFGGTSTGTSLFGNKTTQATTGWLYIYDLLMLLKCMYFKIVKLDIQYNCKRYNTTHVNIDQLYIAFNKLYIFQVSLDSEILPHLVDCLEEAPACFKHLQPTMHLVQNLEDLVKIIFFWYTVYYIFLFINCFEDIIIVFTILLLYGNIPGRMWLILVEESLLIEVSV